MKRPCENEDWIREDFVKRVCTGNLKNNHDLEEQVDNLNHILDIERQKYSELQKSYTDLQKDFQQKTLQLENSELKLSLLRNEKKSLETEFDFFKSSRKFKQKNKDVLQHLMDFKSDIMKNTKDIACLHKRVSKLANSGVAVQKMENIANELKEKTKEADQKK